MKADEMTQTPEPRPRGRPPKPMPTVDATPESAAQAIFSAVKKPDPSIRVQRTYKRKNQGQHTVEQ